MTAQEIREHLPHGSLKVIAERTGLNQSTVSSFFLGKNNTPQKATIIKAAAQFLDELYTKESEAMKAINEVLKPEPANS